MLSIVGTSLIYICGADYLRFVLRNCAEALRFVSYVLQNDDLLHEMRTVDATSAKCCLKTLNYAMRSAIKTLMR